MAYRIKGGVALRGEIEAQGSKNAALPILFACMAVKGRVFLSNLPAISDIENTKTLLEGFGVIFEKEEAGLWVDSSHIAYGPISARAVRETRASSYLLGVGLGCFGRMRLALPGGCALGPRPLDIHKKVFEALGAVWCENEEEIELSADRLRGAKIYLPVRSVGATVNAILCALFAEGKTEIYGYAEEYHVRELLRFLRAVGAEIERDALAITVYGGKKLHSAAFRIASDEIEAATYLFGGVATCGEVRVSGVPPEELSSVLTTLEKMGACVKKEKNAVTVSARGRLLGTDVVCRPYPYFPTDLHPQTAVLLALSQTGGSIADTVFTERFGYAAELEKMGGKCEREGSKIRLLPSTLHGARVAAPDLRAGAALTIAALSADGETLIFGDSFIRRGYERFAEKWQSLGADIAFFD